jgi:hypothetical protein
MSMTRMPRIYVPGPGGAGPLRWQDDQSGVLPTAVRAFVGFQVGQTPIPTSDQIEIIRDYIEYYVNAPCWRQGEAGEVDQLREAVSGLRTIEDINIFIHECLKCGLDPL